jgi:hypothetical protein
MLSGPAFGTPATRLILQLTRASLGRGLQRQAIYRPLEVEADKSAKRKFRDQPLGDFHIDIAEVQTTEPRLSLALRRD